MGWLSTLQVNTPWLGQDNPMAIFMNSYFASTHNDRESFGTVVCYLSVFLQCSGQVHSCSQLQNVPPLSPPFSMWAHQTSLHHSFSTASVSALQTCSPWDCDHQFALDFQVWAEVLHQSPSICQQLASTLPIHQRDHFLLLEDNVKINLQKTLMFIFSD